MTSLWIRGRRLIPPSHLSPRAVQSLIYSTSVQVSNSTSEDHFPDTEVKGQANVRTKPEPTIPMVQKRRDPDAVVKALASTVESVEVPLYMRGRDIADPLYPRGRGYQMEYTQHLEAGRKAAQAIIQKWPKLFPERKTDPNPRQKTPSLAGKSLLECLIDDRKASKAWSLYLTLKRLGKKISLEVENDLLELVSYEGLGNPLAVSADTSDMYIQWPLTTSAHMTNQSERAVDTQNKPTAESADVVDTEVIESTKEQGKLSKQKGHVRIWSLNNIPEVMFSKMKKKDGRTYEALIQGLIKHDRYGRAFEMFQEMRTKGFQASLGTYNLLLSTLKAYHVLNIAKSVVKEMNTEPVVQPDITTMNHLLRVSSKLGSATKAVSLQMMREIFHLGLEPTLTTFVNLLIAISSDRYGVSNSERAEVLEQVLEYLEQNKQLLRLREESDLIFFIQAFTTAKQIGSADLAMRLKALADANHNFLIDNLNLVMSKFLSTVVTSSTVPIEVAMQEYHKLVPKTFVPLEWLYREMFEMCDRHQSTENALKLWQHIQRFGVPLYQLDTWNSFCGALLHSIPENDIPLCLTALDQAWKKFEETRSKPSDVLVTALVRTHALNNNLEEAWRYYGYFDKPSFLALVTLLKKHNSLGDKTKTVEILELMVSLKMYLPLRFVKDILWSYGLDEGSRKRILDGISNNKGDNQSYAEESTDVTHHHWTEETKEQIIRDFEKV